MKQAPSPITTPIDENLPPNQDPMLTQATTSSTQSALCQQINSYQSNSLRHAIEHPQNSSEASTKQGSKVSSPLQKRIQKTTQSLSTHKSIERKRRHRPTPKKIVESKTSIPQLITQTKRPSLLEQCYKQIRHTKHVPVLALFNALLAYMQEDSRSLNDDPVQITLRECLSLIENNTIQNKFFDDCDTVLSLRDAMTPSRQKIVDALSTHLLPLKRLTRDFQDTADSKQDDSHTSLGVDPQRYFFCKIHTLSLQNLCQLYQGLVSLNTSDEVQQELLDHFTEAAISYVDNTEHPLIMAGETESLPAIYSHQESHSKNLFCDIISKPTEQFKDQILTLMSTNELSPHIDPLKIFNDVSTAILSSPSARGAVSITIKSPLEESPSFLKQYLWTQQESPAETPANISQNIQLTVIAATLKNDPRHFLMDRPVDYIKWLGTACLTGIATLLCKTQPELCNDVIFYTAISLCAWHLYRSDNMIKTAAKIISLPTSLLTAVMLFSVNAISLITEFEANNGFIANDILYIESVQSMLKQLSSWRADFKKNPIDTFINTTLPLIPSAILGTLLAYMVTASMFAGGKALIDNFNLQNSIFTDPKTVYLMMSICFTACMAFATCGLNRAYKDLLYGLTHIKSLYQQQQLKHWGIAITSAFITISQWGLAIKMTSEPPQLGLTNSTVSQPQSIIEAMPTPSIQNLIIKMSAIMLFANINLTTFLCGAGRIILTLPKLARVLNNLFNKMACPPQCSSSPSQPKHVRILAMLIDENKLQLTENHLDKSDPSGHLKQSFRILLLTHFRSNPALVKLPWYDALFYNQCSDYLLRATAPIIEVALIGNAAANFPLETGIIAQSTATVASYAINKNSLSNLPKSGRQTILNTRAKEKNTDAPRESFCSKFFHFFNNGSEQTDLHTHLLQQPVTSP